MEDYIALLIPVLLGAAALRLLVLPLKAAVKLLIHSGAGFVCLWLLNLVSGVTGIFFPINAATVMIAGLLGLPGIGIMALLAIRAG